MIENLLKIFNKTTFLIDEAYFEYSKNVSVVCLLEKYNNLIVTMTFSKFFGLANMRVGYIITSDKRVLWRS